mmetsp:Transcript_17685/g.30448  ORF Transcript_17685/g.30448 Transcript_17685/m.30448 type:complete len:114 (-) Transcript_17685:403-744(-)
MRVLDGWFLFDAQEVEYNLFIKTSGDEPIITTLTRIQEQRLQATVSQKLQELYSKGTSIISMVSTNISSMTVFSPSEAFKDSSKASKKAPRGRSILSVSSESSQVVQSLNSSK